MSRISHIHVESLHKCANPWFQITNNLQNVEKKKPYTCKQWAERTSFKFYSPRNGWENKRQLIVANPSCKIWFPVKIIAYFPSGWFILAMKNIMWLSIFQWKTSNKKGKRKRKKIPQFDHHVERLIKLIGFRSSLTHNQFYLAWGASKEILHRHLKGNIVSHFFI